MCTFERLSLYEKPESYADSMHVLYCDAINRPLESYLCIYGLVHTQFLLFSNTLLCPRNFCELVILCVMLLCPNNLVHCYRNVRETQWIPNKPKARRLWPTYRLTSVSVNTPSNSSPIQCFWGILGMWLLLGSSGGKSLGRYMPVLEPFFREKQRFQG